MAFTPEGNRVPTSIGDIVIVLRDTVNPSAQTANYQVRVLDANGRELSGQSGDLVPHLTQTQINQLQSFMTAMRTKAVAEILP